MRSSHTTPSSCPKGWTISPRQRGIGSTRRCACGSSPTATAPSSPIGFEMTSLNLLVVAALGAGESPDLPGAVGRDDGRLVPVVDEAAALALLPEGHDRAALVYDLAARHLYRQYAPAESCVPTTLF